MTGIGDRFQQETKYAPGKMPATAMMGGKKQPALYKEYPDAVRILLPRFEPAKPMSLDAALKTRRSVREFGDQPIGIEQLSYLLWASTGIQRHQAGYAFRTAPSAGALYPIETYIVANNVTKVDGGIYHYGVKDHCLEQLKLGGFGDQVAKAALGQEMCGQAGVVFVWTAIFERCKWKYGQRAHRYVYLDAGHIAENLALAATSLGLGSCEIGALFDDEVNRLIGVDGEQESVLCMAAAGVPA
jgi:SagB-type dehydrogenase family enzyme